ncbi:hypothetical protein ANOM_011873 [Aspergillus nomiae NRRL 13137]|uniref:Uncharacterized protein n=1 Tax=Aspergillus nomiae NRRL (strain ATCC 15546 / NRRL 13137 / CBS 260.88 / M93) TaxID=1509407 RepID=A0A0L1IL18_ASPN3|nr:uncharacterized protein ANOM_011873 [Aspergillus nomiae NRRL 13137]KNG79940.1 hypothetical protein ANOM_011873 [Aspergillus nomiae NRRL 13137]
MKGTIPFESLHDAPNGPPASQWRPWEIIVLSVTGPVCLMLHAPSRDAFLGMLKPLRGCFAAVHMQLLLDSLFSEMEGTLLGRNWSIRLSCPPNAPHCYNTTNKLLWSLTNPVATTAIL